jgi:hypothetical protein
VLASGSDPDRQIEAASLKKVTMPVEEARELALAMEPQGCPYPTNRRVLQGGV